MNGVLLQALPDKDPHALVTVFEKLPGAPVDHFDFSAPDFEIGREAALHIRERQVFTLDATAVPAWRATRVDPLVALRAEWTIL